VIPLGLGIGCGTDATDDSRARVLRLKELFAGGIADNSTDFRLSSNSVALHSDDSNGRLISDSKRTSFAIDVNFIPLMFSRFGAVYVKDGSASERFPTSITSTDNVSKLVFCSDKGLASLLGFLTDPSTPLSGDS